MPLFEPQYNSKTDRQIHPPQKPIMLLERLIRLSSNIGDLVLGPFIGSGSMAVACIQSERNFIGIEKDEGYYNEACKRIGRNCW